jgi:glycosyltransferase involved in cell wall biosynthesis
MLHSEINTENTIFVVLSFEGPDVYSQAGGLGVRVANLSNTLANEGFTTHLFFIGDPRLKGEEASKRGKLILHRWCQWISAFHPSGVYQGENDKICDFNKSIPPYLLDNIIRPAVAQDKKVIVLAEEWHTADVICQLSDRLQKAGLRDRVVIFWNANNTFGFDRINWKQLSKACTITTVSRYMKQYMWRMGLNPMVIPNGIPRGLLNRVDQTLSMRLRKDLGCDLVLSKIARWDPDKRWNMAVEATARLKARGMRTVLLARGGLESYGDEVLHNARSLGLRIGEAHTEGTTIDDYLKAFGHNNKADLINIKFHCPQELLRVVYHGSDAVLANSGREPFGLVGLEAMAAGGVAFTGGTGEDYAISFHNSIVLETSDPREIESYVLYLHSHPDEEDRIRKAARSTAGRFTWEQVAESLIQRLEYQAQSQEVLSLPQGNISVETRVLDFVRDSSRRGGFMVKP